MSIQKSYVFKVDDYNKIDFARIAREAEPETNIIHVTTDTDPGGGLLVRERFLKKLETSGLKLDTELINLSWGTTGIETSGGTIVSNPRISYPGWRATCVSRYSLALIQEELEAIRNWKPPVHHEVKVQGVA